MALAISVRSGAVRFLVRVQPRSSSNAVEGTYGDALKIRLTASPVEGAANEALTAFLADELGVPRRSIRIITGEKSRYKLVEVDGIAAEAVERLASRAED